MASKSPAALLFAVGLLLALLAAFADPLGLGGAPGFGWKQGLGVAVGLALAVVGWRVKGRANSSQAQQ
ncbi:hypothetical protein EG19_01090 [Thermoanaerobaculum aquaticum]|uniref:Uncharacterized protein n=1 Tax=Thermoanaerobaculum aquaticum TaxID=1312852 RepID=A0A062XNM6_9BACT|nr:hypothetical protein [Thermoanaerobaculum aquaticum]KDA54192.1 hypothetical protein EG19_01090 [Thermoanaerobaculum aquaticum]